MGTVLSIPVADLTVDTDNPRLAEPDLSQREALRELAKSQGPKILVLAQDVIAHGLNPSELPIAMPTRDGRYTVLEGNRRLTAVLALENPDLLSDAVKPSVLKKFRVLSKRYRDDPVESVLCFVVDEREDANHWIELKHTGENHGAGVVKWGSDEGARFGTRTKKKEIHTQALDFLQHQQIIDNSYRKKVPATSFKRLLGTPAVRDRLGVYADAGELKRLANAETVAKALKYVVDDLVEQRVKTKDIYLSHQRVDYATRLPASIAVAATMKPREGVPLAEGEKSGAKRAKPRRRKKSVRDILIPNDCTLNITSERIHQIEAELRRLSLERHPNAISVLLRVFLELSADSYMHRRNIVLAQDRPTLAQKFTAVVDDLLSRNEISNQQAVPVRMACQKGSFLAPSITLMHQYVHNHHLFPVGSDLRAHWDSLQPFVKAIWSA